MQADARDTAIGLFEAHKESINRASPADDSKIARSTPDTRSLSSKTGAFPSHKRLRVLKVRLSIVDAVIQAGRYSHYPCHLTQVSSNPSSWMCRYGHGQNSGTALSTLRIANDSTVHRGICSTTGNHCIANTVRTSTVPLPFPHLPLPLPPPVVVPAQLAALFRLLDPTCKGLE